MNFEFQKITLIEHKRRQMHRKYQDVLNASGHVPLLLSVKNGSHKTGDASLWKKQIFFLTHGYAHFLEKANKVTVGLFVRFSSLMGALKLIISRNVLFRGILTSAFSWSEKMPVGKKSYWAISHVPGWAGSL